MAGARPLVADSARQTLRGRVRIGLGWEGALSRPFWPCCEAARQFGHGDRIRLLPDSGSGLPGALVRIADSDGSSVGSPAHIGASREVLLIERALPSRWGLALPVGGALEIRVGATVAARGEQPHKHDFQVDSLTTGMPRWGRTITCTAEAPAVVVFDEADHLAFIGPVVKMPHLLVLVRVETPVRTAITNELGEFSFEVVTERAAQVLVTHACRGDLKEAAFSLTAEEIRLGEMHDIRLDYK